MERHTLPIRSFRLLLLITALCLSVPQGRAQTIDELPATLAETTGAAVHLPATDGVLEASLAASGRLLVQGLALDPKSLTIARGALRAKGLYGVASIQQMDSTGKLPYPDHFLNLLVADLDAVGPAGPAAAELTRVVAPGGALWTRSSGHWTRTIKPMPREMDDWAHPHGSASNNPVSHDKLVRPINTVKWIDSYARFGYGMSQAGVPVVGSGVFVHDTQWASSEEGKKMNRNRLVCRDAFSGVVRWQVPVMDTTRWMAVAGDYVLSNHRIEKEPAGLYIYDIHTGKKIGSVPAATDGKGKFTEAIAVARGGVAYVATGPTLQAITQATLKPVWTYTAEGADSIFSSSLSEDGGRIVFVENKGTRFAGRWPSASVAAISCLDTATGKPLWKNTEVQGTITSYMPVSGDRVFYYCTWGIIAQTWEHTSAEDKKKNPRYFGALDLATGKRLWQKNWSDPDGTGDLWVQVGMVRNKVAWLSSPDHAMGYNIDTGERTADLRTSVVNQRCIRTKATDSFLLLGFGTFLADNGTYTDQNVSRSACAVGSTPAYGSVYQTADGCGCFSQLRGFSACAAEASLTPLDDSKRLETGTVPAEAAHDVIEAKPADTVTSTLGQHASKDTYTVRIPVVTTAPVRDSWINNEVLPYPETAPVKLTDGRELVAVVSEHRLECRKAGKVLWAHTADARITGAPLIEGEQVFFAAHDGYVYCLDAASGARQWRYLVAPAHRFISAYGQLESAWPVRNLVVFDGAICAAAGRHPELDGGIYLAGLDPHTGKPRWTGRIHHDTADEWFSVSDRKRANKNLNWVTNGGLAVVEGKLVLDSLDHAHGGGNKVPKLDPYPIDPANPPR